MNNSTFTTQIDGRVLRFSNEPDPIPHDGETEGINNPEQYMSAIGISINSTTGEPVRTEIANVVKEKALQLPIRVTRDRGSDLINGHYIQDTKGQLYPYLRININPDVQKAIITFHFSKDDMEKQGVNVPDFVESITGAIQSVFEGFKIGIQLTSFGEVLTNNGTHMES